MNYKKYKKYKYLYLYEKYYGGTFIANPFNTLRTKSNNESPSSDNTIGIRKKSQNLFTRVTGTKYFLLYQLFIK